MNPKLEQNWTTTNNGYPLDDAEVERYISVLPNQNQYRFAKKPFNVFFHFGMNTATGREWGSATETLKDFTITSIDAAQWVKVAKSSGATGVILTCKHHDGFCLFNSAVTDFCVKNTAFDGDVVKLVSDECRKQDMNFGVYLSPWDMHEKTYATPAYNDYFCAQLTELLTNYGEIFEVWFDGAKGAEAKAFDYDWERYYDLIHKLQPKANIAICGSDIRWVGNEGGKSRKDEFSVVPKYLTHNETIEEKSQHSESKASSLKKLDECSEDLGSRKILKTNTELCWYPAEVDVSIRKGWFWSKDENRTVKSAKKLFKIYIESVGNNCGLLLNVPPTINGVIYKKDAKVLKKLGKMISDIESNPIFAKDFGELTKNDGYLEFNFNDTKKMKYCVLQEDVLSSQRVEKFDLYIKKGEGKYKKVYNGGIIGAKKIIKVNKKCEGALLIIRQSRSAPVFSKIGFYE